MPLFFVQVKLNGSDKWQAVGHMPGAILVQSGELLAAWTANLMPALVSYDLPINKIVIF